MWRCDFSTMVRTTWLTLTRLLTALETPWTGRVKSGISCPASPSSWMMTNRETFSKVNKYFIFQNFCLEHFQTSTLTNELIRFWTRKSVANEIRKLLISIRYFGVLYNPFKTMSNERVMGHIHWNLFQVYFADLSRFVGTNIKKVSKHLYITLTEDTI